MNDTEALSIKHPDILRRNGELFVFAHNARLAWDPPLAGPFATRESAAWWICEMYEGQLKTPEKQQLWGLVFDAIGGFSGDPYHALQLCAMIANGMGAPRIWKFTRVGAVDHRKVDHRKLAAGDRHVA